jgi:hypothetical protein
MKIVALNVLDHPMVDPIVIAENVSLSWAEILVKNYNRLPDDSYRLVIKSDDYVPLKSGATEEYQFEIMNPYEYPYPWSDNPEAEEDGRDDSFALVRGRLEKKK